MAYTTILNEKMSNGNSPNCYYTVQYEESGRTSSKVTLKIRIKARLQYAQSYQGHKLTATLTVGGTAFSIALKGTEMWKGTATHTIDKTISVSASAGTTSLSASISVANSSGGKGSTLSKTACSNITISRYYTAASISASSASVGGSVPIALSGKYPSSAVCTITYRFGNETGTVASKTTATSLSWSTASVKARLLAQIPASIRGTCTLTCVTESGGTTVGTSSCTIELYTTEKVSIDAGATTVEPVNSNAFLASKNIYVGGYSSAKVSVAAMPGAGSSISAYSITGLGATGQTAQWTSPVLSPGLKKATVTVTDRRGTSASLVKEFNVLTYIKPALTITAERGFYSGTEWTPGDTGNNLKIRASLSLSLTEHGNRGELILNMDGSQIGTYSNLETGEIVHIVTSPVDDNIAHQITGEVTDSLGEKSITAECDVPTAKVNMSMLPDNRGVTFGGHPVIEGLVSEFPAKFNAGLALNAEAAGFTKAMAASCAADGDGFASLSRLLLNFAHPVGSYYWSSDGTDPGTLFGGKWTQITGRFVFAAGGSYAVNSTGGAETVALTAAQMPSHTHAITATTATGGAHQHSIRYKAMSTGTGSWIVLRRTHSDDTYGGTNVATDKKGDHTHKITASASAAGSGGAHNNMPPFIAAYCWRRTE